MVVWANIKISEVSVLPRKMLTARGFASVGQGRRVTVHHSVGEDT
jgi:hypothetical protein